jgi:hypothetical protein
MNIMTFAMYEKFFQKHLNNHKRALLILIKWGIQESDLDTRREKNLLHLDMRGSLNDISRA